MSEPCSYCGLPVNPFDESTWHEVTGYVHGKKKDSLTLRQPTGRYAHDSCVHKAQQGIAPDQASLFDEDTDEATSSHSASTEADDLLLFDGDLPADHDNPGAKE